MTDAILQFEDLSAGYNGRKVLRSVAGAVADRGRIAVIGPNGCGKSTLLKTIMGVLPGHGTILWRGADILTTSAANRNRLGIGLLRQGVNIFPSLSARENLEMAFAGNAGEFAGRLEEVLGEFPVLKSGLGRRAGLFSGGQRQSLALAMVLMNHPHLLLLDEPLAGLSPKAAADLLESLVKIHRSSGAAWLIVEHRLPLVRRVVDQVWVMRDGRIVHVDDDPSILEDPEELARHYQLV